MFPGGRIQQNCGRWKENLSYAPPGQTSLDKAAWCINPALYIKPELYGACLLLPWSIIATLLGGDWLACDSLYRLVSSQVEIDLLIYIHTLYSECVCGCCSWMSVYFCPEECSSSGLPKALLLIIFFLPATFFLTSKTSVLLIQKRNSEQFIFWFR